MPSLNTTGYSSPPLVKKLGIREGSRLLVLNAPDGYIAELDPPPAGVVFETGPGPGIDIAQIFVTRKEDLAHHLSVLRHELRPDAPLWVSWPKKAAKVPTTMTEDTVRELALPLGFVDVKVCAVTNVWSGLKLVVRKELR